jgi:uncharacterized membrane protein YedE/YeeE
MIESLLGGILIGVSSTAMLALLGRVAGISGIVGGLLGGERGDSAWRAAFVAGLMIEGIVLTGAQPEKFAMTLERSTPSLLLAGLLVGFGTRLGSGCTSGHGICGLARASKRSIAATATFMATGALTAAIITHVLGGRL